MRRRLLNVLTALTLLLCGAVCVLWALDIGSTTSRQFTWVVSHGPGRGGTVYGLFCFDGNFFLGRFTDSEGTVESSIDFETDSYSHASMGMYCLVMLDDFGGVWNHAGGFGAVAFQERPDHEIFHAGTILMWPTWLTVIALAVLPAARGLSWLRLRRRLTRNLCPRCGYDLRATPDRCPECGAAPAAATV